MSNNSSSVFCWIWICVPFLILGMDVWLKYPSNHGGGLCLYIVLGVWALIVNVFSMIQIKRFSPYRTGALALLALLLYLCDRFNVLVKYEEWIRRGMPEWGCP